MQQPEFEPSLKPRTLDFEEELQNPRSKTSLRMLYEAQVAVIQKQIGDLERVRTDLGLSQRKMAQLLLVDPSSWTRWTRKGDQIPPHIWRSLQWYLTLREKIPGLTPQYFIGQDPKVLYEKTMLKIDQEREKRNELEISLRSEILELEKRNKKYRLILMASLVSSLAVVGLLLMQIFFRF